MGKGSGNTRSLTPRLKENSQKERNYYQESMRYRSEVLQDAGKLVGKPMSFDFNNGFNGKMEITKSDLKTIVSKKTSDNKFNAFKNLLAKDIQGFIKKAKYEGWRETLEGKHSEAAYFVYYSREWNAKAYLCVRKLRDSGVYKPYAIINEQMFQHEIGNIHKEKPPM